MYVKKSTEKVHKEEQMCATEIGQIKQLEETTYKSFVKNKTGQSNSVKRTLPSLLYWVFSSLTMQISELFSPTSK